MDDADRSLVERIKAGDAAAFERLFSRHHQWIYRFASRMCRHAQDAEDILQDTFLAAFRHRKTCTTPVGSAVARRSCLMTYLKKAW